MTDALLTAVSFAFLGLWLALFLGTYLTTPAHDDARARNAGWRLR